MFELDPRLENDSVWLASLPLSELRLMKDANYPWLVLVPRVPSVTEWFHLSEDNQTQALKEMNAVSQSMASIYQADKMNVAALGNQVSQLHIHVIARFKEDPAWPAPVWGKLPMQPYEDKALQLMIEKTQHWVKQLSIS